MQIIFDIPDNDLLEFGKKSIQEEIHKTLKWMRIKQSFSKLSANLQNYDQEEYDQELDRIREETWNEYKRNLE